MAIRIMSGIWGQTALIASHRKSSGFVCGHEAGAFAAPGLLFARPRFAVRSFLRYRGGIWAAKASAPRDRRDFVKTLRLSAALAALILTASTTCAAVIDLSTALGPSGRYTTQAYYQVMLGGQPMTAAQQAYADQEDQLRLLGFLSELGGDFALGQIFYHIAYGITPPPSALDLASEGSDLPPSITPSGLVTGASDEGDTGSVFTDVGDTGPGTTETTTAVPEASTWAMMLIGFAGLGYFGYRRCTGPRVAA
jgi:hypothetical protein